jgi:hypothetical protein
MSAEKSKIRKIGGDQFQSEKSENQFSGKSVRTMKTENREN